MGTGSTGQPIAQGATGYDAGGGGIPGQWGTLSVDQIIKSMVPKPGAPQHNFSQQPTTPMAPITQLLNPNNPNTPGYNPLGNVQPGGGPQGVGNVPSIDPSAPLGGQFGQPSWWPVRAPDAPGPPIQPDPYTPPGQPVGTVSAQRMNQYNAKGR